MCESTLIISASVFQAVAFAINSAEIIMKGDETRSLMINVIGDNFELFILMGSYLCLELRHFLGQSFRFLLQLLPALDPMLFQIQSRDSTRIIIVLFVCLLVFWNFLKSEFLCKSFSLNFHFHIWFLPNVKIPEKPLPSFGDTKWHLNKIIPEQFSYQRLLDLLDIQSIAIKRWI